MAERKEELKSLLMKLKEESEKPGLKLNIQNTKIMASGPITSWHRWGKKMQAVTDLFSWAPKSLHMVTTAIELKDACSLGGMTKLSSALKSRNFTLPTEICLVKAMVFPVVRYGYKSWTIKKAEHRRIDTLELWCWRRLLRVPWTARRSNQSIPKETNTEYSLEGLMLKLNLQYLVT